MHVIRKQNQTDSKGQKVEVQTDYEITDYKHSCRSCKEMTDEVTVKVKPVRSYNLNDLRPKKSKLESTVKDSNIAKEILGKETNSNTTSSEKP